MSLYELSESTRSDQHLYLEARLVDVACLDCTVTVGVKKNSEQHTSIQWRHHDFTHCPEFAKAERLAGGRHIAEPCSRLRSSIERAVADGAISIGAIDGY